MSGRGRTAAAAEPAPAGLRRRRLLAGLPALASLASLAPATRAEPLEDDEDVIFLPATARLLDDGRAEVDLQAWIHEQERRRVLDAGLARYLGLKLSELSPTDRLRFSRRTALFHAEPERGTVLQVDFGGGTPPVRLPASDSTGRAGLRVVVPLRAPQTQHTDGHADPWLHFQAVAARRIAGRVLLVPPEGLSVVSDIDDTVKKTEVADRHRMLLNTFVRPFEAVPGMARRYRALARRPGTRLHYLSSSPLQLLPSLKSFLDQARFPPGSMHLRESTAMRDWIPARGASRAHKKAVVEQLLADFPARRFLLVGDSGELDPEIYGDLARAHPQRIEAVLVRNVTGEARDATRLRAAFDGVDPARWHLFDDRGGWPLD